MKRTLKFRRKHQKIADYHTSKHWENPEQCTSRFRESLDVIYPDGCEYSSEHAPSQMINKNNDKFWSVTSETDSLGGIFYRKNKQKLIMKSNAHNKDIRRGYDVNYKKCAFIDYIGEYYYYYDFCDGSTFNFSCNCDYCINDEINDNYYCDYCINDEINDNYYCNENFNFDISEWEFKTPDLEYINDACGDPCGDYNDFCEKDYWGDYDITELEFAETELEY